MPDVDSGNARACFRLCNVTNCSDNAVFQRQQHVGNAHRLEPVHLLGIQHLQIAVQRQHIVQITPIACRLVDQEGNITDLPGTALQRAVHPAPAKSARQFRHGKIGGALLLAKSDRYITRHKTFVQTEPDGRAFC